MSATPPPTRTQDLVETLHGEYRIADPYRWLEEGDAPETRQWVAAQNAYTRARLDALPGRDAIRARLDSLLTVGSVGTPHPRGGQVFFQRRDGRQDQPVLMVRNRATRDERVLLDPNLLSATGLVALDWWYPSDEGSLLAYGVSEAGTEWSTLRVLDVASGTPLADEEIPDTRACSVAWLPDASGFYYTRYPEPGSVAKGEEQYHRHAFFHRLGEHWRQDAEVFGAGRAREDWPNLDISRDGRWLVVQVSQGWAKSEVFLRDLHNANSAWVPLHAGVPAWADTEWAGGTLLVRTNEGAPNYRLYAIDPQRPERSAWREVLPERPDRVLNGVRGVCGQLVTEEMRNATSNVQRYTLDGVVLGEVPLPSLGTLNGMGGEWDGDRFYLSFTSFVQPPTAYSVDPATGQPSLYAQGDLPPDLDPTAYHVEQVWYSSSDGTQVSMFLVHRPGVVRDGSNAVVLTGYGGFNVSRTPTFVAALPMWLDAGGVYALPNLRGGGEYGEAWHQAGMLGQKQNVFDDFIEAADWLIANRYTRPERLAITGGSNGGLLVGAALTQRPDLFSAVVCQVPLLDMLRYHHLRIARLWIAEYGSADDPTQFPWLYAYSPYHRVQDGTSYPATLFLTAEGDSRVDPMHARKMAARVQAATAAPADEAPILLRVETAAGHGAGKPRSKVLDEATDVWSFIGARLGVPSSKFQVPSSKFQVPSSKETKCRCHP